jgi:hypothetical protein
VAVPGGTEDGATTVLIGSGGVTVRNRNSSFRWAVYQDTTPGYVATCWARDHKISTDAVPNYAASLMYIR